MFSKICYFLFFSCIVFFCCLKSKFRDPFAIPRNDVVSCSEEGFCVKGILFFRGYGRAIVEFKGKQKVVAAGDEFRGYKVEKIESDHLIASNGEENLCCYL
jgi:hypothetical protein